MLAALLIGLALWIIHLANTGVPGPVIAGVYIAGPVDVAVLAVYMLAAMVLATIATSMISRVPSNRIGWILTPGCRSPTATADQVGGPRRHPPGVSSC